MMDKNISTRDWQDLSAYLDGQLSNRERARVELHLERHPELQDGLDEIQGMRTLLRQFPVKRAPRNFTLTPEMVGIKKSPPRSYPVLRFASALSTVLLMLVWFGNLLFPMGMRSVSPLLAMSEQPEVSIEVAEHTVDSEIPIPGREKDEEYPAESPPGILGITEDDPVEGEEGDPGLDVMVSPEDQIVVETIPTPHPTTEFEEVDPSLERAPGEDDQEHPRLAAGPPEDNGEVGVLTIREHTLTRLSQWDVLNMIMAALAFIAISTGMAAVYVRRKESKWS